MRAALQLTAASARDILLDYFEANPELFFEAGFDLLKSAPAGPERCRIFEGLLEQPEFLLELVRPGRFSLAELTRICREFAVVDRWLDLHLARLLPGRWEDLHSVKIEVILRVLHILDEISIGPRLIPILGHLTTHGDPQVAEGATLLIGKRIRNWGWTQRRLESGGPEVRAGVIEGLWGVNTPEARSAMRRCLEDDSELVVGKAVLGLHLLREDDVWPLVERMAFDERPAFRAAAARLAGQIGEPEYMKLLELACKDDTALVRLAAKEAMAARRQAAKAKEEPMPEAANPVEPPKPEPAAPPSAPEPKPKPRPRELHINLDGKSSSTRWD